MADRELPRVEIRPLSGLEELRECVRLQEETWGEGFTQRVPEAILLIAPRLGGVVSGAFLPDGAMAGFVFGLTGVEDGKLVHWSDMLAVRRPLRGRGIGTALKAHQRELLLELGVARAYWTFDPLETRNAELNLGRLGAVAREYVPEMYGPPTSPLHAGIGTDRLVALWELKSERVRRRVSGREGPPSLAELGGLPRALGARVGEEGDPAPSGERTDLDDPRLLVTVPGGIQGLKLRSPALALRWREATRRVLRPYLERGWEARELVRDGNLSHYLLIRREARAVEDQPKEAQTDERE